MKREQIGHLLGQKVTFRGKFVCYSDIRYTRYGRTVPHKRIKVISMLFSNVYINGIYVDHMWVRDSKRTRSQNIKEGSIVEFNGVVETYDTGYNIGKKRNIKVISEGEGNTLEEYINKKYSSGKKFLHSYSKIIKFGESKVV